MKILAIMNAHALAHVSRLLEIAKVLRARGHEIAFAGHGKYLQIAIADGFKTFPLPYISVERVITAVRSQKLWTLYRESELESFIAAELALYEIYKPDLILLDNRPSARTSADIAGIKTVAVLNVQMSNYRRYPFFSYRQLLNNMPGTALLDLIENKLEFKIYDRLVMGGLNSIRKKHGLKRLCAGEHEEGELSFLADIPEFNPINKLPPHVHYIGPLTWHNNLPTPESLDFLNRNQPIVYLTLGSESLDKLIAKLGPLTQKGIQFVVATGATNLSDIKIPQGVFLEQYINAEALLPYCDLVCCHGGNGTIYQALRHGLPIVVVATHAEQHYGGKRIQELGLGKSFTLKNLEKNGIGKLVEAVQQVLDNPQFRNKAREFSKNFKSINSAKRATELILQFSKQQTTHEVIHHHAQPLDVNPMLS